MPDAKRYEQERRKMEARKFDDFYEELKGLLMKYADTPVQAVGYLEAFKLRLLAEAVKNLQEIKELIP